VKSHNRFRLHMFLLALAYLPGVMFLSPFWMVKSFLRTTAPWILRFAQRYSRLADKADKLGLDEEGGYIVRFRIVPVRFADWLIGKANDAAAEVRREQIAEIDAVMTGQIEADKEVQP